MASKEFEFYVKSDLSRYKGQYIAIVEDRVVAFGDNAKTVFEQAEKKTGKIPTIAKIPKEEGCMGIDREGAFALRQVGRFQAF